MTVVCQPLLWSHVVLTAMDDAGGFGACARAFSSASWQAPLEYSSFSKSQKNGLRTPRTRLRGFPLVS